MAFMGPDPKLADALREAGDRVAAMTPVQRALLAARQAVSYVEGGLGVALPDDHEARITARALALLDRVGDAAAEALIEGTAAVVPWPVTVEMVRASNPVGADQDLLAHFTLHEGIAAGRLDREGGR